MLEEFWNFGKQRDFQIIIWRETFDNDVSVLQPMVETFRTDVMNSPIWLSAAYK